MWKSLQSNVSFNKISSFEQVVRSSEELKITSRGSIEVSGNELKGSRGYEGVTWDRFWRTGFRSFLFFV